MSDGVPQHEIDRDFPRLWQRTKDLDDRERLGRESTAEDRELDAALRELWDARRCNSEQVGYECAHKHRWWMAAAGFSASPTRCPICGTSTFQALSKA